MNIFFLSLPLFFLILVFCPNPLHGVEGFTVTDVTVTNPSGTGNATGSTGTGFNNTSGGSSGGTTGNQPSPETDRSKLCWHTENTNNCPALMQSINTVTNDCACYNFCGNDFSNCGHALPVCNFGTVTAGCIKADKNTTTIINPQQIDPEDTPSGSGTGSNTTSGGSIGGTTGNQHAPETDRSKLCWNTENTNNCPTLMQSINTVTNDCSCYNFCGNDFSNCGHALPVCNFGTVTVGCIKADKNAPTERSKLCSNTENTNNCPTLMQSVNTWANDCSCYNFCDNDFSNCGSGWPVCHNGGTVTAGCIKADKFTGASGNTVNGTGSNNGSGSDCNTVPFTANNNGNIEKGTVTEKEEVLVQEEDSSAVVYYCSLLSAMNAFAVYIFIVLI